MTTVDRFVAAMLVALAPGAVFAQTALSDPAVPGSGYRIPEVHTAGQPVESGNDADLSVPGDGYRIPEVHTVAQLATYTGVRR
jgi:hypothetical protein